MTQSYSRTEEILNALSHGLGVILSIAGLVVLVTLAACFGDAWKVTASAIYGASMIVLYSASTMYHGFSGQKIKRILNMCDHISIYFLIAGTYTPFVLVTLRGAWGWTIFGIVWGSAVIGTTLKIIYGNKFRKVSTALYLAMGWVVVVAAKPLIASTEPAGLVLLLIGGLLFSFGVIFYKWKSLPYNHAIWHIFVLAGTICHFFAVLFFVVLSDK